MITSPIYDQYLGGKDNFAIDRETAESTLQSLPLLRAGVRERSGPWTEFAILCGYTTVMLALGMVLLVRRDA